MGSALFELGEVLGARGNVKAKILKNGGGTLFCRVTAAAEKDYGTFHLQLQGLNLDRNKFRGTHNPFFVLNSQVTHGGGNRLWLPAHRSEVVQTQTGPAEWKGLDIPMEKICGGDPMRAILVEVFDFDKSGKHKTMGKFETSVNGLISAQQNGQGLDLVHQGKVYGQIVVVEAIAPGGIRSAPSTPAGAVAVAAGMPAMVSSSPAVLSTTNDESTSPFSVAWDMLAPMLPSTSAYPITFSESASSLPPPLPPPVSDVSGEADLDPSTDTETSSKYPLPPPVALASATTHTTRKEPTFVDYLSGGLEINLSVAIDFTGSNGDPRIPGTLHYICPGNQLNDYEKALTAVGSIVARYDSDQRFPVLGFGARVNGQIQHCFQVGDTAESVGVQGVLKSYRSVFKTGLIMSYPTIFAEVIQHAAAKAQRKWEHNRSIGKQSYEILLILTDGAITDFDETKSAIKTASSAPLSIIIVGVGNDDFSSMKLLDQAIEQDPDTRDIVKFVQFSRFSDDRQALTRETMDGVPEQVVDYFYRNQGVIPSAAVTGSDSDILAEDYDSENDVDLVMSFGEDGTIQLADNKQATWDSTCYGTAAAYLLPPAFNPSLRATKGSTYQSQESAPSVYVPPPSANAFGAAPSVYLPPTSAHSSSYCATSPQVVPTNTYASSTLSYISPPVSPVRETNRNLSPYCSPPLTPVREPTLTPYVLSPASSMPQQPRQRQSEFSHLAKSIH